MGKRKRKHQKTSFPWMVEEKNLFIIKTGNEIVTDAGWEKISFEEARKLFSPETFQEWYELFLENVVFAAIALTPQPFTQANHRNVPPFFKKESSLYGGNNC
ncbi:MAG: hypothetical protein V7L00_26920 [Nostoc sp.]|uniref:hypothetical protein n=1 Tax=Nostoc sp. TaxID=1180 RepID=UPI002FF711EB